MNTEILRKIGLSEGEEEIYLVLLRIGSSRVSQLAKETGIHRTNIYDILEKLREKGLVSSVTKENRMYFQAAHPEQLTRYFEEKQERLQKLILELKQVESLKPEETSVEVFKGREGIKTVLKDIIRNSKDYIRYGEEAKLEELMPVFLKQYLREIERGNIHERLLVKESRKGKVLISKNAEVKYLPDHLFTPSTTYVYGKRVAIFAWTEPFYVVSITNSSIAESYRKYFELLWQQNTLVFRGIEGPTRVLKEITELGQSVRAIGPEDEKYWKNMPEAMERFIKAVDRKAIDDRILIKQGSKKPRKAKSTSIRYYPPELFSPISTEVFGNKVAIISWAKQINTILIEDEEVADSFRKHFELLWNQKVMTYQGAKNIELLFDIIAEKAKKSRQYLAFGIPPQSVMFYELLEEFGKRLRRYKVVSRTIADETGSKAIEQMVRLGFTVKTLPKRFITPFEVDIAGNLVAMIAWTKKPYAFSIEDKQLAKSFTKFFKVQWEIASS